MVEIRSLYNDIKYKYIRDRERKSLLKLEYNHNIKMPIELKSAINSYWNQYTRHFSPVFHDYFFSVLGTVEKYYIPSDIMYTDIEEHFNDCSAAHGIDNKNMYNLYFPEMIQPKTVIRRINQEYHLPDYNLCSLDEAIEICASRERIIFKPALDVGCGDRIVVWQKKDGIEQLKKILADSSYDFIGQDYLNQSKVTAQFNPTSVNTIRLITFLHNKEVTTLAAILRIGKTGSMVDNMAKGGSFVKIYPDGKLENFGYNWEHLKITQSENGSLFANQVLPNFKLLEANAHKMAKKIGDFHIVAWDFALDNDDQPVFIEMNLRNGDINNVQLVNGPLFGAMTDEVLKEVFIGK